MEVRAHSLKHRRSPGLPPQLGFAAPTVRRLWERAGKRSRLAIPTVVVLAFLSVSCLDAAAPAPNPSAFTQVAVGENHFCALRQDGRVHCWGKR